MENGVLGKRAELAAEGQPIESGTNMIWIWIFVIVLLIIIYRYASTYLRLP
ncbi:hypothetical protein GOV09_02510 [Candidatus Woesearchaeota archaeon]|nr:hypothetical protein [Candidatus Woesearchaeota archaeon]